MTPLTPSSDLELSPSLRLGEGRRRYFDAWGFGDGGYDDRWVVLSKLGSVPLLVFPNTKARVRSVRLHDLHHVLTGYRADWTGEAEIAAWELAAGCADHGAAWALNLLALAYGVVIAPRRVLAAWARGRRSSSLYREVREWDEALLSRTIGEMRARLGLDRDASAPTASDVLGLSVAASLGWALALAVPAAIAALFQAL